MTPTEPIEATRETETVQTSAIESPRPTFGDLNGMAAKEILGWEEVEPGRMYRRATGLYGGLYVPPPCFATDMRDTWALVEKLTAEGFQFELQDNSGTWEASFDASLVEKELAEEIFVADADSAALATLPAALKTRGIVVEREDIAA